MKVLLLLLVKIFKFKLRLIKELLLLKQALNL